MKGNKMSFVWRLEKSHMVLQAWVIHNIWTHLKPATTSTSLQVSKIYNLQTYSIVKVRSDAPGREISCLCICTKLIWSLHICQVTYAVSRHHWFPFLPWGPSSLSDPLCGCIVLISQFSSCQTRTNVFWFEFGSLTSICVYSPDAGLSHWLFYAFVQPLTFSLRCIWAHLATVLDQEWSHVYLLGLKGWCWAAARPSAWCIYGNGALKDEVRCTHLAAAAAW